MKKYHLIGIAGSGTMGASIAETFAKFGYSVVLYDLLETALEKAAKLVALNQETEVSQGMITAQESQALLARISYTSKLQDLAPSDFLIEAIVENLEIKHRFWMEVSALVAADAILVSNTSGLSITAIAEKIQHPQRFAGMHWINPPHIIPLIEVICGKETAEETGLAVRDLAASLGKKPVIVQDAPGFVLNRIQFAILRECLHIAQQGIATPEAIDQVMVYGLGMRYACLGPFQVADLGGLDIFYNIASYLFEDLGKEEAPFHLLKQCKEENRLGVKNQRGFYDYQNGKDEEAIRYRDEMFTKLHQCLYGK